MCIVVDPASLSQFKCHEKDKATDTTNIALHVTAIRSGSKGSKV